MSDFTPEKRPTPPPDISLMQSAGNAYVFLKDNYHTLLKWAVVPIILNFVTYMVLDWQDTDGSLASFLVALPSTIAFAWYAFVQTRLQVLGEHAGQLPLDDGFADQRRQDMTVSVSFYILFQMAMAMIAFFLSSKAEMVEGQDGMSAEQMITITAGLIIMLWMLKYGLLHIVTAVGGSVRDYLDRVKGMWFSFIIIGVGFVSSLPVALVFTFALSLAAVDSNALEGGSRYGLYAISTIMSWAFIAVLNAALVEALRQLYQGKKVRDE